MSTVVKHRLSDIISSITTLEDMRRLRENTELWEGLDKIEQAEIGQQFLMHWGVLGGLVEDLPK